LRLRVQFILVSVVFFDTFIAAEFIDGFAKNVYLGAALFHVKHLVHWLLFLALGAIGG